MIEQHLETVINPNPILAYKKLAGKAGALAASLTTAVMLAGEAKAHAGDVAAAQTVDNIATINNGALEVNGKLDFPFMSWRQCVPEVAENKNIGVNTFMGSSCDERELATAVDRDGYMIVEHGSGVKYPNVIGTYLPDEPDGYGVHPSALPQIPENNAMPVFQTFTPHFAEGHAAPTHFGKDIYPSYLRNLGRAGVAGFDSYYLNRHGCWNPWIDFGSVYHDQRDLVNLTAQSVPDAKMPTYQWIETNRIDINACPDPVTPAKVEAEMWLAVAGGAKGLGFFTHSWVEGYWDRFSVAPDIGAATKKTSEDIQSMADLFLKGELLSYTTPRENPVKTGLWRYEGKRYALSVNSSEKSGTAIIPTGVTTAKNAVVMGEGRTVAVSSKGLITDDFEPLEKHMYVLSSQKTKARQAKKSMMAK